MERFPLTISDPKTVSTGELYIDDLLTMGVWQANPATLKRAVCTIGERYRDCELTDVVIGDYHSAFLAYTDGKQYQFEFVTCEEPLTEQSVRKLEEYAHSDMDGLVVVMAGKTTLGARDYCETTPTVERMRLDPDVRESCLGWG